MKIIDLLVRIANGEDVPKTIKKNWVYEWSYDKLRDEFCYITKEGKRFDDDWLIIDILDDEIEIIEDKKIEHYYFSVFQDERLGGRQVVESLENKLNEIIDKINEMENKND